LVTADPAILPIWVIAYQDILFDGTYKPALFFDITIEYDVVFFNRRPQGDVLQHGPTVRRTVHPIGEEEKKAPVKSSEEKDSPPQKLLSPSELEPLRRLFQDDYVRVPRKTQSLKA